MANEVFLSQEGYKKLEIELDQLRAIKRKEVAEALKTAREYGDLSENAEFDAAKDEKAKLEGRISELERQIKNAVIIDENASTETVSPGCFVKVFDEDYKEEDVYKIVGVTETDISQNYISNASPIGGGLMGHKVGETVEIKIPAGVARLTILEINR